VGRGEFPGNVCDIGFEILCIYDISRLRFKPPILPVTRYRRSAAGGADQVRQCEGCTDSTLACGTHCTAIADWLSK
jgi:hypothetical protein